MNKLKNISVVFLTFLMLYGVATAAESLVKIEVKKFDGNLVFIFYHDKGQEVSLSAKDKVITAVLDVPADFQLLNSSSFAQFATDPQSSTDKKKISFVTTNLYKSPEIINGEKLTAIKFRLTEDQEGLQLKDDPKKAETPPPPQSNTSKDNVQYKLVKNDHVLSFDFANQDAGMAAFFRGKYLWVVFDQPKIFAFDNSNNLVFSEFTQITDQNATILRIKVNGYNNAYVSKKGNLWNIAVTASGGNKNLVVLTPKQLEDRLGVKLEYSFIGTKIIDVEDRLVGDKVKVVTFKTPNIAVNKLTECIDFNLIPSIQGVAIAVSSDDGVDVTKDDGALSVECNNKLLDSTKNDKAKLRLQPQNDNQSLLPMLTDSDNSDFITTRSNLIISASLAQDSGSLSVRQLEIARFFFVHGLYKESLSALELSKKTTATEYNNDLKAQFLAAVNYTLQGIVDEAATIYTSLISKIDEFDAQEIMLWSNYNDFVFGKNPSNIGFLNNINKFIKKYPDNLYWSLALAEIDLNMTINNLKTTEAIFKELRTPPAGNYANSLQLYKALYYRKKGQTNLAKQFLQDLVQKEDDPFNLVRAEMELVKLQLSKKEIHLIDAIKRLEQLRFVWRGDTLEYNLLQLLGGYYRDAQDGINALRTYHYISSAFNNQISNFYITSEMVKIFNSIFLPRGSAEKMSAFETVALFYEFQDLNPVGTQGDEVILLIAKRLIELDLLDQAVNILQHQVSYRLTGEKRIINANHLAIALLMNKKPADAIEVLDTTDLDNIKFDEHQYRVRLKAKALIDMKKYLEALDSLAKDYSEDAIVLKKECLFQAERWQEYIDLVAPIIHIAVDRDNKITGAMQQDILRLAIAYYMINDQATLAKLAQSVALDEALPIIKDTIDLLMTTGKPIDYKNLDQSLDVNQMQMLVDKYKSQLFN